MCCFSNAADVTKGSYKEQLVARPSLISAMYSAAERLLCHDEVTISTELAATGQVVLACMVGINNYGRLRKLRTPLDPRESVEVVRALWSNDPAQHMEELLNIGAVLGTLRRADLPMPLMAMILTMINPTAGKRLGLEQTLKCPGWEEHNRMEFVGGVLEAANDM